MKQFLYAPLVVILAALKSVAAAEQPSEARSLSEKDFGLERTVTAWNGTSFSPEPDSDTFGGAPAPFLEEDQVFPHDFPSELSRCIGDHRYQIADDYARGKNIILNCFKATLMLSLVRYLGASPESSIKLFDGLVELKKVADKGCAEGEKKCGDKYARHSDGSPAYREKRARYERTYKKAMEKLVEERMKVKNWSEEEKAKQLNKINEGSRALVSEMLRDLGDEEAEKAEEEKLKKEVADPRLVELLDALSRNYELRLKFYPGVSARMSRSRSGGVTFDLELSEGPEEENEDDESSTREIKDDRPQAKDFDDSEEGGAGNRKKSKKGKKKKKEIKKKAKKLKKIIPYLLLPLLIQMTLLPFVFKKLFFLAMKALFAGKVALILVAFNLLRNTCIRNEDNYAQKIRVEHYGYAKGEEYGAWLNGRALRDPYPAPSLRPSSPPLSPLHP